MDPSLLKEREAFLRRARTMQFVETPRINQPSVSSSVKSSSPGPSPAKRAVTTPTQRDYLTIDSRPQNQGRFALLSKVVKYMKQRHLERDIHPLSVDEILEETMLQDAPLSDVKWLETEAIELLTIFRFSERRPSIQQGLDDGIELQEGPPKATAYHNRLIVVSGSTRLGLTPPTYPRLLLVRRGFSDDIKACFSVPARVEGEEYAHSVPVCLTALPNNPKIHSTPDGKFVFRPKYEVRNKQELYQLLKKHEVKGLGGIYLDDLAEAVADVGKVVQSLGDNVIQVVTPHDKKVVLFYNDKTLDLGIKEEFKQLWRAVSVEGMHEVKIEEYLRRNGITSMSADKKIFTLATKQKRAGQKRASNRPVKLKDNEHLQDILKDFSQK